MRPDRTSLVQRFGLPLLTSVAVHALAALALSQTALFAPIEPVEARPVAAPTRVHILSEEEVDRLAALADRRVRPLPPPPKPEAEPEPEPEPEEKPTHKPPAQVVEIPPPAVEEVPDDARFVSEYNSRTEREMVSANRAAPTPKMIKSDREVISKGDDVQGTADAPRDKATPEVKRERADPRVGEAQREAERPGPPMPFTEKRRLVDPTRDSPVSAGEGLFRRRSDTRPTEDQPSGGGGKVGGAAAPEHYSALLPTLGPQDMDEMDGSIDHVEDIDRGDRTFLNTREYKHAWFFNRVKRAVAQRWRAVEAHRRNDPFGRVYGVRDRLTVVEVTLSATGALEDIHVFKDSGVAFLDEAAVQAFLDAQPFPNPPADLRDPDGRIRFRFSFFLEINGRGGFNIFR